jgi:hypothetical protein
MRKSFPVVSIILYILAALMLFYTVWAARNSIQVVSQAVEQNQLVISGNEFEVASFFMSNLAQYGLFAIILFSLGWITQGVDNLRAAEAWEETDEELEEEEEEQELQEIVEENREGN